MNIDGNSLVLNEMLARLAITGEKTSAHDFSSDVGNTSRGDDSLGSLHTVGTHSWAFQRAADRSYLLVPSTKTKIGSRSFRIAAPTVWNSLPLHLWDRTISERLFPSGVENPVI